MDREARIDAGRVIVSIDLRAGRVASATVRSERPRGLATLFVGRAPDAVPDLARRLFALCGLSQATAARHALRAAGAALAGPAPDAERDALAAERLAEHLRATVIDWSGAVPLAAAERAAVPAALSALAGTAVDAAALGPALAALGLAGGASAEWVAGSWAGRLLGFARTALPRLAAGWPDPLSAADDAAVLAALDRDGDAFAAQPGLPGRAPQTGPAARAALGGAPATQPAARLAARLAEIAAAAAHLSGVRPLDATPVTAGRLDTGTGFAAVETPRGRLHHLAALDRSDRVARYLILAPTEWNFAAGGPCAAALAGIEIGPGDPSGTIRRLASLFDPCVECRVEVRGTAGGADDRQEGS